MTKEDHRKTGEQATVTMKITCVYSMYWPGAKGAVLKKRDRRDFVWTKHLLMHEQCLALNKCIGVTAFTSGPIMHSIPSGEATNGTSPS